MAEVVCCASAGFTVLLCFPCKTVISVMGPVWVSNTALVLTGSLKAERLQGKGLPVVSLHEFSPKPFL